MYNLSHTNKNHHNFASISINVHSTKLVRFVQFVQFVQNQNTPNDYTKMDATQVI